MTLGAGRAKKGQAIDHAVGILIHHKVGDFIVQGQPLFTIHANDPARQAEVRERLSNAHLWSDESVAPLPIFYGRAVTYHYDNQAKKACININNGAY